LSANSVFPLLTTKALWLVLRAKLKIGGSGNAAAASMPRISLRKGPPGQK